MMGINKLKYGLGFYGIIFIAVSLGILLVQISEISCSGFWIMGIGFLSLILSWFIPEGDL